MFERIEDLPETKIVGKHINITLSQNADKTPELWRSFMPDRDKIENRIPGYLFSIQIFN